MTFETKLDKIIDILYDENTLLWKKIPTTDLLLFGKEKFGINWSEPELQVIIDFLISDGYVERNDVDFNKEAKSPTFSLTTKGIQIKRKGEFKRVHLVESFKQNIILWGSIFAILVGGITIYDFVNKTWFSGVPIVICKCDKKDNDKINNTKIDSTSKNSPQKIDSVKKIKKSQSKKS